MVKPSGFFDKNKIPEVDQAMSIYENFISDEELKSILETQEIKYKLDRNEWYAEGRDEGLAEGLAAGEAKVETNAKIEAVINLIKELNLSLDQAMTVLKVDISYKSQIEDKLKELGIKYN